MLGGLPQSHTTLRGVPAHTAKNTMLVGGLASGGVCLVGWCLKMVLKIYGVNYDLARDK